jgi:hypothetical protein
LKPVSKKQTEHNWLKFTIIFGIAKILYKETKFSLDKGVLFMETENHTKTIRTKSMMTALRATMVRTTSVRLLL